MATGVTNDFAARRGRILLKVLAETIGHHSSSNFHLKARKETKSLRNKEHGDMLRTLRVAIVQPME
jgi:hypothetical protein